ncbi:MAG: beta-1,6-N-acetylglucosaminyltransferase [Porphyromonadaceae bacterium]|nr:beta-1,6-N-acetylglucosaminyltransferase [Porphyromonadaceae bacterium]
MKHAYLILAHHEFELLRLLITSLDDVRNDIYLHLDLKVKEIPDLEVNNARLIILQERVDVRWGDVSVVEAEFALFKAVISSGEEYGYCHLLSGVDLPLKSQDYIHSFFKEHAGKEFVGFYCGDDAESSIDRKVRRWHYFPKSFKGRGILYQAKRVIRFVALRCQIVWGFRRHQNIEFRKGTQWVSLTLSFVEYLVERKEEILRLYRFSFCADEIFIQTALWNSPYKANIYNLEDESRGCMRYVGWESNVLRDFTPRDLPKLKASDALWARKFNGQNMEFLRQITSFTT